MAMCDGPCNRMYPPGYPDEFYAPWPVSGPVNDLNGRLARDRADSFHICGDCLREMVLKSFLLSRDARARAPCGPMTAGRPPSACSARLRPSSGALPDRGHWPSA